MIKKARDIRDQAEKDLMGGFKKIFPPEDPEMETKYNKFYDMSAKICRSEADVRKKLIGDDDKKGEDKS